MIVVAVPLVLRLIGPNPFYGVRTRKSYKNPEVWYTINVYGGRLLIIMSVIMIICAVGFRSIPHITVDSYSIGMLIILVAMSIPTLSMIMRRLQKL